MNKCICPNCGKKFSSITPIHTRKCMNIGLFEFMNKYPNIKTVHMKIGEEINNSGYNIKNRRPFFLHSNSHPNTSSRIHISELTGVNIKTIYNLEHGTGISKKNLDKLIYFGYTNLLDWECKKGFYYYKK